MKALTCFFLQVFCHTSLVLPLSGYGTLVPVGTARTPVRLQGLIPRSATPTNCSYIGERVFPKHHRKYNSRSKPGSSATVFSTRAGTGRRLVRSFAAAVGWFRVRVRVRFLWLYRFASHHRLLLH